jgi:hypothetical protein
VRELVTDVIAAGVEATVSKPVRETVEAVGVLAPDEGVMTRAVAEKLDLDKSTASRRLRMAADGGYVRNLEDRPGKPGRWLLGDPMPEDRQLLPNASQLCNPADGEAAGQGDGCTVAADTRGIDSSPGGIRRDIDLGVEGAWSQRNADPT